MSRTCSRFILFLFLPFLLPFFVLPFFLFPFHLLALSIHSCVEPVNFIYQLGITGVIKGDDLFRIGGSRNLFTYNFQRFVGKRYGRSRKGKIRMSIRRGRNGEKLRERIIKKEKGAKELQRDSGNTIRKFLGTLGRVAEYFTDPFETNNRATAREFRKRESSLPFDRDSSSCRCVAQSNGEYRIPATLL